jgi:serine/threonine protein kinase
MPESKDRSHATGGSMRGAKGQLVAGRYQLMRRLGRGGMGTVWLAADELLGRLVAVKELRPPGGLAGADLQTHQRRALQEARSAARIQHPNAVTLYEVIPAAAADDPVYLIMELVEGPTLGEMIARDGPLPASRVAAYGLQLLDVLAVAQALGIVHRDVKPDNIMITARDQVKLSDFGIAHTVGDPRLTPGGIMGTQAYMAPELFEAAPITPAADLWSLGATLYYAADGHGAFDRESAGATLRAILLNDLPVPSCDPCLAAAITGLLCRDPRGRATIEQAHASLRQVPGLRQAPEPQPPSQPRSAPTPRPGVAPGRRDGWDPDRSTGLHLPTGPQTPPPPKIPTETHKDRRLPGNRLVALAAVILLLVAGGVAGGILATRPRAGSPGPAASGSATRSGATSAGGGTATPPGTSITSGILTLRATIAGPPGAAEHEIAYSPDGTMLVTYGAASDSDAILRNAVTGAFVANLPFGTGVSDVAFSPDSQTLAVAERYGGIGLWNVASHSVIYNLTDTSIATAVAFSPDGSTLAVADGSGVRMLDVATRTWGTTLTVPGGAAGLRTVLFIPGGNTLAAADSRTGYVYVWDVSTGALIGTIAPPANDPPGLGTWIGYSTTTGLLAIGSSGDGNTFPGVRFWAVQSRKIVSTLQYPGVGGVNGIAYDPANGALLAVVGMNGKVFVWEMPEGTGLAHPLDPGAAEIADVAFSPDGKTLAVLDANDRIFLWSVTPR